MPESPTPPSHNPEAHEALVYQALLPKAAQTEVYSRTPFAFPSPTFILFLSKNTWKLAVNKP